MPLAPAASRPTGSAPLCNIPPAPTLLPASTHVRIASGLPALAPFSHLLSRRGASSRLGPSLQHSRRAASQCNNATLVEGACWCGRAQRAVHARSRRSEGEWGVSAARQAALGSPSCAFCSYYRCFCCRRRCTLNGERVSRLHSLHGRRRAGCTGSRTLSAADCRLGPHARPRKDF